MKRHWHNFVFLSTIPNGTKTSVSVVSKNYKHVDGKSIVAAREGRGLNSEAILIGVSYLGYMTEEEFNAP